MKPLEAIPYRDPQATREQNFGYTVGLSSHSIAQHSRKHSREQQNTPTAQQRAAEGSFQFQVSVFPIATLGRKASSEIV